MSNEEGARGGPGGARVAHPIAPTGAIWSVAVACVGLMVLGSFADYGISAALLNEASIFGRLGATFGWFPAAVALTSAGMLLLLASRDGDSAKVLRYAEVGVGSTLIIGSAIACIVVAPRYWNEGDVVVDGAFLLWVAIGLGTTCVTVALSWWLGREANASVLRKVAVFLLLIVGFQAAIIFVVKLIWLRPRMLLIAEDVGVHFEPWWAIGYPDIQQFLDLGIAKDAFKSFPSAHTGNAAVAMSLPALVTLRDGLTRYVPWMFALGVLWAFAVAFSRIIVGAHFVTDTTVGFLVTFALTIGLHRFLLSRGRLAGVE